MLLTPHPKFARRSSTFGSVDGPDFSSQAEAVTVRLDSGSTPRPGAEAYEEVAD